MSWFTMLVYNLKFLEVGIILLHLWNASMVVWHLTFWLVNWWLLDTSQNVKWPCYRIITSEHVQMIFFKYIVGFYRLGISPKLVNMIRFTIWICVLSGFLIIKISNRHLIQRPIWDFIKEQLVFDSWICSFPLFGL